MSRVVRFSRAVHLSHVLRPGIPCWPGDPPLEIEPAAYMERDGFYLQRLSLGEHTATHVNAPSHFLPGGAGADDFHADALIMPAVVIDCRADAAADPDFALTPERILRFEALYGTIPPESAVLLWTGWQERWPDPTAYFNPDSAGGMHFPGIGVTAVEWLLEERRVAGFGIDTHGIDPGFDDTYAAGKRALAAGAVVLENLTNLDQLPPVGATLVVGVLRIARGSGGPAAVLALVP